MSTAELTRETYKELNAGAVQKRILLVDDEEDLTWSISKTLAKHDRAFEVTCAHNGDEALAVLARRPVDVVVSDIRMPGRDGLQLLQEINSHYPATKVIIMTAYGSHETRKLIAARGNTLYLEKPFEIRSLRRLIYEALELAPPDHGGPAEHHQPNPAEFSRLDPPGFFKERLDCSGGALNAALLLA
jgi:DNA-binding NtrC family response regulator